MDEVSFSPVITLQPASQVVAAGQSVILNVAANGNGPLSFQWLMDGTNLPGAGSSTLWISSVNRRNTGNYAAIVTCSGVSMQSSNAYVQVLSPQRFQNESWQSDGSFRIVSEDIMGVGLLSSEVAGFEAQFSTNLVDWTPLGTQLQLVNGNLVLIDPGATNITRRIYRIMEHLGVR